MLETILFVLGRILFGGFFLMSGIGHLRELESTIGYASAKGVKNPKMAVIATGIMMIIGGLTIIIGNFPEVGIILLLAFLIPTSFKMHRFWTMSDPGQRANEMIAFSKNIALIGALLMLLTLGNWDPNF